MTDDFLRADRDDAVQALQDILAALDDGSQGRENIREIASRAFTKIACRRMGVANPEIPDKPYHVMIRLPDRRDSVKCWAKRVIAVNRDENHGYAFEGPFLAIGTTVSLPRGAVVLIYRLSVVASALLYQVADSDTGLAPITGSVGKRWARDLMGPCEELLRRR
jgi:hypothetical protein